MADSPAKRAREARKRRKREIKAERKRLRKEGLLGKDEAEGEGEFGDEARPTEETQDETVLEEKSDSDREN